MEHDYLFPDDRAYEPVQHMWVRREDASRAVVGIDALGLSALGELAYVALSEEGRRVRRGESMGTLEAAKMTGEFFSPISGVVVARNAQVLRTPQLINSDPYGAGWLVVIAPEDWESEQGILVQGAALSEWTAGEVQRYRAEGWID